MKRKLLFTCVFILGFIFQGRAQTEPLASTVLDKAYAEAKAGNKKVFVMFHASWCSWCKKMDAKMSSPQLKNLFDSNYVIAHLTVQESPKNKSLENPGAAELLKRFGGENSGIPFFVILDSKGKLLEDSLDAAGQNLGCPATPEEVGEFKRILKNTSKLSDKELNLIAGSFTIKK
jgi:thioredoxin-related protein